MKTLTVREAAKVLKTHPRTLYRHIQQGRVPAVHLGRSVRIPEESLRRWMGLDEGSADRALLVAMDKEDCVRGISEISPSASEDTPPASWENGATEAGATGAGAGAG